MEMPFKPNFTITEDLINTIVKIEAVREEIKNIPITLTILKTLRESAKLQSIHYSTAIEGNKLNQMEVKEVIEGNKIKGKERDEKEVKGYYVALDYIEKNNKKPITEETIKTIHSLVESGGKIKVKPTPYRDGQNVIRDSVSGRIVYIPPETKDVPLLMKEFIEYINKNINKLFTPILAAIVHYQMVTIHPYYDGNGRTARLLTNLILYKKDYDLNGIYSLEEYYAKDLQSYYRAISIGDHHNYYFGRIEADITPWIEYFVYGMLKSFENIKKHTQQQMENTEISINKKKVLRSLTPQTRKVLTLFVDKDFITSKDIAKLFNFSQKSATNLALKLVEKGILKMGEIAKRNRNYVLSESFGDFN